MRTRRRAPHRGIRLSAIVTPLVVGATALAVTWLSGGAAAGARAPSAAARVLAPAPVREKLPSLVVNVIDEIREPRPLTPPGPPPRTAVQRVGGSLEVALFERGGRLVPLRYADRLKLRPIDRVRGAPVEWYVSPDRDGRIRVSGLPPGRYSAELRTALAGDYRCALLMVDAKVPSRLTFLCTSEPLDQRIAVRFTGPATPPLAADLLLHAKDGSTVAGWMADDELAIFDGLPPGSYDLEVRVSPTQSCWQRDLRPGMPTGTLMDLSKCPRVLLAELAAR